MSFLVAAGDYTLMSFLVAAGDPDVFPGGWWRMP